MKLLLIEDNIELAKTLCEELRDNFIIEIAHTAEEGEYKAHINSYDLIILDYILPDMRGIEVGKNLRSSGIAIPIIMVTVMLSTKDKVAALDSGIDDYLTKPFDIEELKARIRALLRRPRQVIASNHMKIGDILIDLDKKHVTRGRKVISLRRKEFDLLVYLARNANRVLTREMILNYVWDSSEESDTNIVDVHIKYLRDHIDKPFQTKMIKTLHKFGYKLEI